MEEVKSLKVQSTLHQCSSLKTLLVYKPGCPSPALPNACKKYKTSRVTQPPILFSFILSRTSREQALGARCVAPLTFSEPALQYTGYSQFNSSGKNKKEVIWSGLALCIYQSFTEKHEHPEKHSELLLRALQCSPNASGVPHAGDETGGKLIGSQERKLGTYGRWVFSFEGLFVLKLAFPSSGFCI